MNKVAKYLYEHPKVDAAFAVIAFIIILTLAVWYKT